MRQNFTIDNIFKEGLNKPAFRNKEQMWQRLEKEMDDKPGTVLRYWQMLLLCLCMMGSGYFLAGVGIPKKGNRNILNNRISEERIDIKSLDNSLAQRTPVFPVKIAPAINTITEGEDVPTIPGTHKRTVLANTIALPGGPIQKTGTIAGDINGIRRLVPYALPTIGSEQLLASDRLLLKKNMTSSVRYTAKRKRRPLAAELEGGTDLSNREKQLGYYAGARIVKNLGVGRNLSVGLCYSVNKLSENYSLLGKPREQTGTDAVLTSLTMVRLPVQYQQQIPATRITCLIGLTPAYILDATVRNIPNNYGDPALSKKFTISNIHRLNVLFSAGLNYQLFSRISLELTGNYGLTELVKNSYFNQSTITANFKNVQAAILYKFR